MEAIDKIILGDNQFFGINHRSQEKAEELLRRFSKLENIIEVYENAFDCGINAIMLNSNQRAQDICDYFRENKNKYPELSWYPSVPYAHKYADMVNELGILPAINETLIKGNSAAGLFSIVAKGGAALFGKDAMKMMEMLIDVEYKMFHGLNVKVFFLQNIFTDLILGYNVREAFEHFCEYIRKKYHVIPGFITLNMPYLKRKLEEWGIDGVVICSSINKIGFNMYPSKEEYETIIAANDPTKYQLMAINPLASGSISPKESFDYINGLNIQSVVFGASTKSHLQSSFDSIRI